jgi:hypothetical protein
MSACDNCSAEYKYAELSLERTVNLLQWMCIPFAMLNEHVGSMSTDVVDWVGRVDPSEYAFYVDYGLLLVFGGIPWQVSQKLSSRTMCK